MSAPTDLLNAALEGRYRIEGELGRGGMATVYLADDLKHGRKVALKVLRPELSAVVGAERFLAEIRTTANLQHPHILPLYDSGEANGLLYYVMPLVEGETLRDRLDREKQLPVQEAVRIATDVAEALHAAHEHGVIHRDVKPANILLSRGRPMVADFGIALAVSAAGGHRLTETGLSLGTPYYMSPEQASADRDPSRASDVYSLGCVLYEMLVGEPPFTGSSAQAVLARVLTSEAPSASAARASTPPHVDGVVRKALEKLPADRFHTAHAFATALADTGFRHGLAAAAGDAVPAVWRRLAIAALAVSAVAAGVAGWALLGPEPPGPVEVFELAFRPGQQPEAGGSNQALSADGSTFVYGVRPEGSPGQLWLRRWDDPDGRARPIPGTEGGQTPTFAPDGGRLAFSKDGMIRIISLEGGPSRALTPGLFPVWGRDDHVYATWGALAGVLRVHADGGPPDTLTRRTGEEIQHFVTDVLPNGWPLIWVVYHDPSRNEVRALDPETSEMHTVVSGGSYGRVTASGHVLYLGDGGVLTAAAWDARAMRLAGTPVPIYEDVLPGYHVSESGRLVHTVDPRTDEANPDELVWVDRSGRTSPLGVDFDFGGVFGFGWSLSPDGRRVALRHRVGGNRDIWLKELPEGPLERLTVSESEQANPWWTPDGASVMFATVPEVGSWQIWTVPAGAGSEPRLFHAEEGRDFVLGTWTPDGEALVASARINRNMDLLALRPAVDTVAVPLVATEFQELTPSLSRDGRWLAYASDRTGRFEVYVHPFPDVASSRLQVSAGGGLAPVWAHNGRELFSMDEEGHLVSTEFETAGGFRVLSRSRLFVVPDEVHRRSGLTTFYDVASDDQRFLMGRRRAAEDAATRERTMVVNNLFALLRRTVG